MISLACITAEHEASGRGMSVATGMGVEKSSCTPSWVGLPVVRSLMTGVATTAGYQASYFTPSHGSRGGPERRQTASCVVHGNQVEASCIGSRAIIDDEWRMSTLSV